MSSSVALPLVVMRPAKSSTDLHAPLILVDESASPTQAKGAWAADAVTFAVAHEWGRYALLVTFCLLVDVAFLSLGLAVKQEPLSLAAMLLLFPLFAAFLAYLDIPKAVSVTHTHVSIALPGRTVALPRANIEQVIVLEEGVAPAPGAPALGGCGMVKGFPTASQSVLIASESCGVWEVSLQEPDRFRSHVMGETAAEAV